MRAAGDQSRYVGDIRHEYGVHLTGDLCKPVELDGARDGRTTAEDELR
jgi:hypothetical protein